MKSASEFEIKRKPNPKLGANFLSVLSFWYTIKIFKEGCTRDLTEDDLTGPLDEHRSDLLGRKIAINWMKEVNKAKKNKRNPSLAKVIIKTFATDVVIYGLVLFTMEIFIRLLQPLFVGLFIRYFTSENKNNQEPVHPPTWFMRVFYFHSANQSPITKEEAIFYGAGIMVCSAMIVSTIHPYMMAVLHVGMRIRVACCSLIYRKALRLKLTSLGGKTVGNAINLMSNDVTRFDLAPIFLHYLWIAPLQMLAIIYFIYMEVEESAIYGMMAVMCVMPIQIFLGFASSKFRNQAALRTDERVRQMNEIIQSMQVIKMYAWENAFALLINQLRRREINVLRFTSYIRGLIMSFIMFTSRLGIFLTVLTYVYRTHGITAETVFLIGSYYQIIRQTMTVFFPQGVATVAEAIVSIRRIEKFMLTDETDVGDPSPLDPLSKNDNAAQTSHQELKHDENAYISIEHGIAKYGYDICLDDINLEVVPGELTAIVGPVGAGKSCLLNLILDELKLFSGQAIVKGTISYACQEPWLFAGSVRQNIIFGRPLDVDRYRTTIKVCALTRDLLLLPYGDRTIVGERGISLSGGQRARVNLARAVYKEADIYLLDDPLSAVDIQVGQHLFEECIYKYLSDKIVILVTHQLQYLKRADQIVIMSHGIIKKKGSFNIIVQSGVSFANLLEEATTLTGKVDEDKEVEKVIRAISITSAAFNSIVDIEGFRASPKAVPEMRTLGSVDFVNYKEYFKAGGNCCIILIMIMLFLGAQCLASGGDFFLAKWVILEELRSHFGSAASQGFWDKFTRKQCITIYTSIMLLTIVVAVFRSLYFFTVCMRSSVNLHNRMFNSIIKASMRFFHTNTSGRILNRFSKDLGQVDELLPNAFIDTTQLMLNLVGAIVVVTFIELWLLIPTGIMIVIFYFIRKMYLKTSRSVKRLEGIVRSPVFAHLNATLQGLPTIRSNGAEVVLVDEFDKLQDIHSSAWFMFLATSRAFGLWTDLICTMYIGVVTFSFIVFTKDYFGSDVGLCITQCIGLSGLIQWGMRQSAELENQMTSVERVLEFTRIEHEPDLESTLDKKPPLSWPRRGRIEFKNVVMQYSPFDPPVLKNLNFVILPQEKIGIVGRTGAGKSSLIVTLFRLSQFKGTVLIDNLNIGILGLHDLRRKISIIPQEPVLFSGTLRYNLDPFKEYRDKDILSALLNVEIGAAATYGEECLDLLVTEGGTNISVGQRQMICLARAILRNNNILVLDEATANVDAQTDKQIQNTIRTKFAHCTVLTIAHRLHTVMDSDKVLVMDAGEVAEFDHPYLLLEDKNSHLSDMVKRTGPAMEKNLRQIAKESFATRQTKIQTTHSNSSLATQQSIFAVMSRPSGLNYDSDDNVTSTTPNDMFNM